MTGLNQLLDLYVPPALPRDLAGGAVAAAIAQPQQKARRFGAWHRISGRGGWKRSVWLGSAALGLAFTSAVAAEVVSGGQIEIPVVHQVVEAIPASLKPAPHKAPEKKQLAAREIRRVPATPVAAAPSSPVAVADQPPLRQRLMQRFGVMQQRVQERRAAGLPTPRADRLERQANGIIARRQAQGLPTPPVEQVEMRLAMRQVRIARIMRRIPDDPAAISEPQVQQFMRILPPQRRERFVALDSLMQRQTMVRFAQRLRARRAERLDQAPPVAPQRPSEEFPQPPR